VSGAHHPEILAGSRVGGLQELPRSRVGARIPAIAGRLRTKYIHNTLLSVPRPSGGGRGRSAKRFGADGGRGPPLTVHPSRYKRDHGPTRPPSLPHGAGLSKPDPMEDTHEPGQEVGRFEADEVSARLSRAFHDAGILPGKPRREGGHP